MNDRIDVLALQATDSKGGLDRHKFAELIVSECVMLCDKVYEQNHNVKIQAGAIFCREDIKEHFGVEE